MHLLSQMYNVIEIVDFLEKVVKPIDVSNITVNWNTRNIMYGYLKSVCAKICGFTFEINCC